MSFLERLNVKPKKCFSAGCEENRHWFSGSARQATYCKACLRAKRRETRVKSPRHYASSMHQNAKTRSAKKGIDFQITIDDVLARLNRCGWRCEVTGVPVKMPDLTPDMSVRQAHSQKLVSPSLDRINADLGYTPENIRITSCAFNLMRATMTDDDLLDMCYLIVGAHKEGRFANS